MIVNELGKETIERDIVDDSNTDLDFYIDGVSFDYIEFSFHTFVSPIIYTYYYISIYN